VEVIAVPTIYPAGGAKQLIETLTGKQVPSGKLSTDIGIQVFNVGTAYALARAVHHGEPLISRLVTVTGHVLRPQNFEVLIGTPMHTLIDVAGDRDGTTGVLMGGPMMGVPITNTGVPVVKATNCILVKSGNCSAAAEGAAVHPLHPLRRRLPGRTAAAGAVPLRQGGRFRPRAGIPPVRLHRMRLLQLCLPQPYSAGRFLSLCQERNLGTRKGKARLRPGARTPRVPPVPAGAREKEKAEKLAAKAQAARAQAALDQAQRAELAAAPVAAGAAPSDADAKKALIAAALARAQAKKAEVAPKNVDHLPPATQREIEEIEARRAKIRELAHQPLETDENKS
jgi:Na+-translocating ferredoxin:NAD+ oxidoreductase subunit C